MNDARLNVQPPSSNDDPSPFAPAGAARPTPYRKTDARGRPANDNSPLAANDNEQVPASALAGTSNQRYSRNRLYDLNIAPTASFLSQSARAHIEGKVRYLREKFGAPQSIDGKIHEANVIRELIPEDMLLTLRNHVLSGAGFVVLGGLPTDPVVAEAFHLALSQELGLCFNYKEQNDGHLVMRLVPKAGSGENTNTTLGEFAGHSDDAFMDQALRTKWIALYGVANPPDTFTGYAPLEPVWKALPRQTIEVLCSPRFRVRMPISFGRGDGVWSEPRPVLFMRGDGERCVALATYAVRPADEADREARAALDSLLEAFAQNDVWHWVHLKPGTFLIFDNDRGLHKRTAIKGDRLIYRTYIRPDLNDLRRRTASAGYIFSLDNLGL